MKKLCCLLLSFVFLLTNTFLIAYADDAAASLLSVPPEEVSPLFMLGSEHEYDKGLIDGGLYYVRNSYCGTYLDVESSQTTPGAGVSCYTFHGELNQQFYFSYLGFGIYEITPVYVDLCVQVNEEGELRLAVSDRSSIQRYRIQMTGQGIGLIFTECSGFTKALSYDDSVNNGVNQRIKQMDYDTIDHKEKAVWYFERVNSVDYDRYESYYIRNAKTGQYLDVVNRGVAEGELAHLCAFYGAPNAEWKVAYNEDTYAYTLIPGHKRDMALDYRNNHVSIYGKDTSAKQALSIRAELNDNGTIKYLIRSFDASDPKYLALGELMEGTDLHYVTTVDNCDADNDGIADDEALWVLEKVEIDMKDSNRLWTNTWLGTSIVAGYNKTRWFVYESDVPSRYKIELSGSNVALGSMKKLNGSYFEELDYGTYNGIKVMDVFLQANTPYFIPVSFTGTITGGASQAFTIRIRQLAFVGHSHYDLEQNIDMDADIVAIRDKCAANGMHVTHKSYMTVTRAKTETNSITSYRDFNAEVFVYSGHGQQGCATYDGTNRSSSFDADELPDMSNCELAIWDCCQSANKYWGSSLVSVSIDRGAGTVIGWNKDIEVAYTLPYMTRLFAGLCDGMSVKAASDAALSLDSIDQSSNVVTSIVIEGNQSNVLFYSSTNALNINSNGMAAFAINADDSIINRSEYTLYVENSELGIKLYTRMINGIPSDDYFIEFYSNGRLTNVKKSHYTMTDADIAIAMEQYNQMVSAHLVSYTDDQAEEAEYQFRYINGELVLVEKRVISSSECECCLQAVFYNAITGEVIFFEND